jgi:hypothetical protein
MTNRLLALLAVCLLTPAAWAACVNKFVVRTERPHQVVTLLTGKLTFQEAQDLAKAIAAKQAAPLEWVDADGKAISKQFGDLKVTRPMPVGCDGRTSGSMVIVKFMSAAAPSKKMSIRFKDQVVAFEQQVE